MPLSVQFSSFSCIFRQILAFQVGAPWEILDPRLFRVVSASCTYVSQLPSPFVGRLLIRWNFFQKCSANMKALVIDLRWLVWLLLCHPFGLLVGCIQSCFLLHLVLGRVRIWSPRSCSSPRYFRYLGDFGWLIGYVCVAAVLRRSELGKVRFYSAHSCSSSPFGSGEFGFVRVTAALRRPPLGRVRVRAIEAFAADLWAVTAPWNSCQLQTTRSCEGLQHSLKHVVKQQKGYYGAISKWSDYSVADPAAG